MMMIYLISVFFLAYNSFALSLKHKNLAEQITCIFENNSTSPQYGYVAKLKDYKKRGITFGRDGFTTCQDGLDVLNELFTINSQHVLLKYRPIMERAHLKEISCIESVKLLEQNSFKKLIRANRGDEDFIEAQKRVHLTRYINPSVDLYHLEKLKLPASFLVIYDAFIQHGEDDDGEGIGTILKVTRQKLPEKYNENIWIMKFLEAREEILRSGDSEWRRSLSRIEDISNVFKKNPTLEPFHFISREHGEWDLPN
jgi:hypothetical protein